MSAASPSPTSSTAAPPPQAPPPVSNNTSPSPSTTTTTTPPPQSPPSSSSSSSTPSPATPSTPPPSTPPPATPSTPPPSQPPRSSPPPPMSETSPPPLPPPPPNPSTPPPPPRSSPPRAPPQSPVPPRSSPPPSPSPPAPSRNSPPPQQSAPPPTSPPPPRNLSPPLAPATPPRNSPPPPSRGSPPPTPAAEPPKNSPPPVNSSPPSPLVVPPPRSSPPPPSTPPQPSASPPPASTTSPRPSPPHATPPSSRPAPPSNSTPNSSALPPSVTHLSPPPPSHVSTSPPSQNGSENSSPAGGGSGGIGIGGVVAISVVAGIFLFSFIGIAIWCLRRQKRKVPVNGGYVMPSTLASSPDSDSSFFKTHSSAPLVQSGSGSDIVYTPSDPGLGNSRSWFSYEELIKATNGFSTQNLLGEGGFGSVYKGYLPDGREIAVKQLKIGGGQGEREFKAEVEIISRIHHRHLVSLVGYCIQDTRRLLVYDYVPNNNLYFHLHGEGQPVLEWSNRVKVAAGAARGIAYLHEDCNPRIIHRDIKSSNILLDYNYEARVSDFGLAKLALDANTHVSTRVMGTFGYVAPEYASSGKLTEKSDVYSFGVVLLELITGRKPVDASQPLGDESLVEWARPLLSHALDAEEFDSLADPRLEKNYVETELYCMIEVAAACVRHSAAKRPRMGQVVRAFDSLAGSDLTNGMRLGDSEVFDSAQQSEEIRLFRRMAFGSQNYSTDFFSQASFNT
ncbi:hypothetical protein RJT34_07139 [Clitoria ternatea]|uniref:non-specific serine/threonine protein kinase n=1 Tax=Clitoria ternatea TaxID=43366 RepID=A0AAN9K352_CLITE